MELLTLSFTAALLLGLSFGAGPCNITCLPYLGPVLLAEEGRWRVVLPFSLGRISGYAALGALAGTLGHVLTVELERQPVGLLLGIATLVMGGFIWRRAGISACSGKGIGGSGETALQPLRRPPVTGLFAMGAGMALNPCVPLGTVLLAAAFSGGILQGLSLGLAFGLGAVVIPTLLFALLVAHFAAQVRAHLLQWRSRLERGAGALLMILGLLTAAGWIQA